MGYSRINENDLYAADAIDGLARRVTSQKNISGSALTPKQERENLVEHIKYLERQITGLPRNSSKRRELGQRKQEIQKQISEIRPSWAHRKGSAGIKDFFIDAAKQLLSKQEMDLLWQRAHQLEAEHKRTVAGE